LIFYLSIILSFTLILVDENWYVLILADNEEIKYKNLAFSIKDFEISENISSYK
jgi:hypothetical protein